MSGYLYLFFQIWVWILLSFILGWVAHWFFCCRRKDTNEADVNIGQNSVEADKDAMPLVATPAASTPPAVDQSWKPHGFTSAPESIDDLKRIKGVGFALERALNNLGIYHYQQVADMTPENIKWVDDNIPFPGKVVRKHWVKQAKALAEGQSTEYSNRFDDGKTPYKS